MDPRRLARTVAVGRVGFGIALFATPERLTERWLGPDARRGGARVAVRGLGARDLALGLGALISPPAALAPWVLGGIVADVGDLLATATADGSVPLSGRWLGSAIASGGAALGAVALAGLRSGS